MALTESNLKIYLTGNACIISNDERVFMVVDLVNCNNLACSHLVTKFHLK